MKRLVAFTLVLVLVLSLCAAAFADYYPTVEFASASKNKLVKYGKKVTLKIKCNSGTGDFRKTPSNLWRACFVLNVKKGSYKSELATYGFSGTPTVRHKFSTDILPEPEAGSMVKFSLTATSYYRKTIGNLVYLQWHKNKSAKTKLRVYR